MATKPTVERRYYNPQTGRYISADPLGYPDGLNDYLYVHNDPVNRVDPLGLRDETDDEKTNVRLLNDLEAQDRASAKAAAAGATKDAQQGKVEGAKMKNKQANQFQNWADSTGAVIKHYEETIAKSKNIEGDPSALKIVNAAMGDWRRQAMSGKPLFAKHDVSEVQGYDDVRKNDYKCNAFVAEVLGKAIGVIPIGYQGIWRHSPPSAEAWHDGTDELNNDQGWTFPEAHQGAEMGDIISNGTHCGISLGDGMYLSARDSHRRGQGDQPSAIQGNSQMLNPMEGVQVMDFSEADKKTQRTPTHQ